MKRADWKWYGMAGHLCVADSCRFHMLTNVGRYLVSTVGDYRPRYKHTGEALPAREEIGFNRMFDTYVFRYDGAICDCGCGGAIINDLSEIDGLGAQTAAEAQRNHMKMCEKWAAKRAAKEPK